MAGSELGGAATNDETAPKSGDVISSGNVVVSMFDGNGIV
jgi:hypothetical protein